MTTTAVLPAAPPAASLRNLYYVRFGFAIVWASLMVVVGKSIGPVSATLIVLYPLFDAAAAVVDLRSSRTARLTAGLYFNTALSLLTAVGLAVALTSGIPGVLRVWGVWAITAGLVQLVVAIRRYRLGGQWPMILSGGISVFAGANFIRESAAPDGTLATVAGYAVLGGIFFLISALRLHSVAKKGN
ncbi:hypothetical protein [Nocardiopsis aegyptia]|uniref:Uncharacterized membrane protein HdeD (DUF308 family) n=1 Tax=Nocardiopsis aegyptia TaxID=220378 RepID=A0A7Z0JB35_9ACTN|nr:hypothetical protein [Nocardiopsis aegyptia]NYJ35044.1 uncharacterized membrane protein HdeD (DUF308 family) [Nocardiopsis aegyptia]